MALENSKEVECPNPDCDSKLFYPSICVRKISELLTGTGKPAAITQSGPLLCVKCNRPIIDADLGYFTEKGKEEGKEEEGKEEGKEENKEEFTKGEIDEKQVKENSG